MQGVEILTSAQVVTEWSMNMNAFWIIMIVVCILFIVYGVISSVETDDWTYLVVCVIVGVIMGTMLGFLGSLFFSTKTAYETQYKVTISEKVLMTEFYEHYEVIDQDGKIFTVREK